MAVVFALRRFKMFVMGARTIVLTDHQPLLALFSRSDVSNRILRWALELQAYDFEIKYLNGKSNIVAHALSRIYLQEEHVSPESIKTGAETMVLTMTQCTEWCQDLMQDSDSKGIIEKLKVDETSVPWYWLQNDCLFRLSDKGHAVLVVPSSKRQSIFDEVHSGTFAAQFNARKINRMLRQRF